MRIFAHRQADNQAENSITEAHSNPLWSVDSRGAGQQMLVNPYIVTSNCLAGVCTRFELFLDFVSIVNLVHFKINFTPCTQFTIL